MHALCGTQAYCRAPLDDVREVALLKLGRVGKETPNKAKEQVSFQSVQRGRSVSHPVNTGKKEAAKFDDGIISHILETLGNPKL